MSVIFHAGTLVFFTFIFLLCGFSTVKMGKHLYGTSGRLPAIPRWSIRICEWPNPKAVIPFAARIYLLHF